jgi:hypothetical protein
MSMKTSARQVQSRRRELHRQRRYWRADPSFTTLCNRDGELRLLNLTKKVPIS